MASLLQRIGAYAIDLFFLVIYIIVVSFTFGGNTILFYLFAFPVISCYHLLFEIYNKGQSPGKMLLKIRVVTINGSTPSVVDYFTRWIFRMIDITFSFGMLAISFITSSMNSQRIGDILARTSVVKKRNEYNVDLKSIKNLEEGKTIKYRGVTNFSDEDMLLVKQSLLRYKRYDNDANKELLNELAKKVMSKLNINSEVKNNKEFLERVLYEYILLTR